jgi:hypothetical protein
MDWKQIAGDFEADGSLRDIYVLGTTLVDWQNVIAGLYKFDPPPIFKINDVPTEIPLDIQEIFNMRSLASTLLSFPLGKMHLNCNFFQDDEIEFDLDPAEVDGQQEIDRLETFMRYLAKTTNKMVILTPENTKETSILRCSPESGEVIWVPSV